MNSTLRILLVEDDALIGADLSQTLSTFGYTVLGPIRSGEDAIQQLESLAPDFILMDIKLKGKIDGIQTAEAIQRKVALPIVFLTGLTDDESFQRAKLLNPYGYLIKPFDGRELHSTIELTLHRFSTRNSTSIADNGLDHEGDDFHAEPISLDTDSSNDKAAIISYLERIPLFRNLPHDAIKDLATSCSIRQFEAGDFISFEGDNAKGGFIPVSGRISIMKTTGTGKELIVALLAPGDVLGLQFASTSFATDLSARTQIASRVIWLSVAQWDHFKERNPELNRTLNSILTDHLVTAYGLASSLAHASVEGRIVRTLLALLPQFGKSTAAQNNTGRIYITRKELAELTGTTPETAYRVTKNLERESYLDLTRPGILKITDINKLKAAAAHE